MGKGMVWAAALLASACLHAQPSETDVRVGIGAETRAAFARSDYDALEKRYAAALAKSERTPSGVSVAGLMRDAVVPQPTGESDVPGRDDHWLSVEHKLRDWVARHPRSSFASIAQSAGFMDHAWSWRGGGYARTVSPEGFRKMDEYAQRAYEALMAREEIGRKDPNWYAQLLRVARVQGWQRERLVALMDEAINAFPSEFVIYSTISTQLTPRWGGSAQAVAGLAAYAVERSRATEGESMYARVYWAVGTQLDTDWAGPDVDWKRIRAGFDDLVQRYPVAWNLNHYARYACEARDAETARRVLLQIKGGVDPHAWRGRTHYLRCLEQAGLTREDVR